MYKNLTNKEICQKLGISNATLVKHLTAMNIPLKGKGGKNKLVVIKK